MPGHKIYWAIINDKRRRAALEKVVLHDMECLLESYKK